jgi:hypothetical protein
MLCPTTSHDFADVARIHILFCHHWPMHTASDGFFSGADRITNDFLLYYDKTGIEDIFFFVIIHIES